VEYYSTRRPLNQVIYICELVCCRHRFRSSPEILPDRRKYQTSERRPFVNSLLDVCDGLVNLLLLSVGNRQAVNRFEIFRVLVEIAFKVLEGRIIPTVKDVGNRILALLFVLLYGIYGRAGNN
jgi:hypothetical protein